MCIIIETERLILRPLRVADAEDVFAWVGDPIVNRYMPYALYTEVSKVEEWIRGLKAENLNFGFELKETGHLIGAGSISPMDDEGTFELGYNLRYDCWNKGYTTEASKAMIAWVKENRNAKRITASHAVKNPASGRVMQKCGMVFIRFGQYSRFDGSETFDAAFYELKL